MTRAYADDPQGSAEHIYDEDTIEFQLSSEHVASLSRAAEPAQQVQPATAEEPLPASSPPRVLEVRPPEPFAAIRAQLPAPHTAEAVPAEAAPATGTPAAGKRPRIYRWAVAGVGLTALAAAGLVLLLWPAHRDADPLPPPPPPKVEAPEPTVPAAAAVVQDAEEPPMRFRNPFDHSEVFEFPAGTSVADARQAVAEILLQRAQDRHPARFSKRHRAANTAADSNTSVAQNSQPRR